MVRRQTEEEQDLYWCANRFLFSFLPSQTKRNRSFSHLVCYVITLRPWLLCSDWL